MTKAPLRGIDAVVFDAYGTLFDYNAAAQRSSKKLGSKAAEVSRLWREKQVQSSWLLALMGRHADFWQVTGEALDFALETFGISNEALKQELMGAYLTLDCFPEVPPVLKRLKQSGLRLAILSNGTPSMLAAAVRNARLEGLFDAVISVEAAGIYKPHPKVYQLAVDGLGVAREKIAFVSANGWDAHGAAAFGFKVIWCNRYGQCRERLPGQMIAEIRTLAEFPAQLGL